MKIVFDRQELMTVLAALRFYQNALENHQLPEHFKKLASDMGAIAPMSGTEIDELCEQINR